MAKAEAESVRNWDRFYRRNGDHFFKDRHYLADEFVDLASAITADEAQPPSHAPRHLLEVGCGVGNALFPLRRLFPALQLHGCDASKNAIALIRQREGAQADQADRPLDVWVQDVVHEPFPSHVLGAMHYSTLIFVLSAIDPRHHASVLTSIRRQLRAEGGLLFLRDYARFDHSQLRFASSAVIGDGFYLRADGTRSFFFDLHALVRLLEDECGFCVLKSEVVERRVENRKERMEMRRRFVQITARPRPETGTEHGT